MLKKSVVKRSACRSVIWKFLISEKSQFAWPGPRNVLRPRSPKFVVQKFAFGKIVGSGWFGSHCAGYSNGAGVNAAGFKYPLTRVPMLPLRIAAAISSRPRRDLPPVTPGADPAPRKRGARAGIEHRERQARLNDRDAATAHPPSALRFQPSADWKNGRS